MDSGHPPVPVGQPCSHRVQFWLNCYKSTDAPFLLPFCPFFARCVPPFRTPFCTFFAKLQPIRAYFNGNQSFMMVENGAKNGDKFYAINWSIINIFDETNFI